MTWLDSGGQRLKVKVTARCRDGEGIHVVAGTISYFLERMTVAEQG